MTNGASDSRRISIILYPRAQLYAYLYPLSSLSRDKSFASADVICRQTLAVNVLRLLVRGDEPPTSRASPGNIIWKGQTTTTTTTLAIDMTHGGKRHVTSVRDIVLGFQLIMLFLLNLKNYLVLFTISGFHAYRPQLFLFMKFRNINLCYTA